jgi:N-acetylglucosaminyldiphosphoundecaprenol N-acetyl-beta-D-mannosaminyltransferase
MPFVRQGTGGLLMSQRIDVQGVKIDNVTLDEALDRVLSMMDENRPHKIYTPNSEIIMQAYRNSNLRNILNNGDLLVADGAGVVLASKILKRKLKEKVSGIDLVVRLLKNTSKRKTSFYILGGKPGVAEKALVNILSDYPNADIVGYHHGYFSDNEIPVIIDDINSKKAEILLVGLGAPKQEIWIHEHAHKLNCKVLMGIGGAIDVFAGTASLAPEFMRKAGLEWLYRLIKEPSRYKRMLDLPRFMALTIKTRFRKDKQDNKT